MISLKAFDILKIGVERKASDIYIKAGSPPALRVTGTVQFLEDCPPLTPQDTAQLAREIMNDEQWEELNRTHEIDMAF
ncbi:MAG: type IV pili twitching motility protein PilT, partial [Fervidicoccus sp.]